MAFKEGFLWGAATAATQIEGAYDKGGKVLSIWDVAGERIANGESCHDGCDHYHRYKEDVKIIKKLGLNSYRFSINWCRIVKEDGTVNEEGISFYKNLLVELRESSIEPIVTLYHWDLPVWVHKIGGWGSRKTIDLFLDYVKICVDEFSEYVTYWMTFNEPTCFLVLGNLMGVHAPFERKFFTFHKYLKNMLLSHGKAVSLIRNYAKTEPKIGIAMAASAYVPDSSSPLDLEYARKKTFDSMAGKIGNTMYMDPIVLGKTSFYTNHRLSKEEIKTISVPIDFIGINCYQPMNPNCKTRTGEKYKELRERNMLNWVVDGRCLYWVVRFYYERYNLPIMVSENGVACPDVISNDGLVHDEYRKDFIKEYLGELKKAVDEDIPVIGYLHWSLMDNFEWCFGYRPRFGLVHIDYETKKRTIKDSAYYYKSIVESNGESI